MECFSSDWLPNVYPRCVVVPRKSTSTFAENFYPETYKELFISLYHLYCFSEWVGQKRSKSVQTFIGIKNCVKLEMELVEQVIQQLCVYHTERGVSIFLLINLQVHSNLVCLFVCNRLKIVLWDSAGENNSFH